MVLLVLLPVAPAQVQGPAPVALDADVRDPLYFRRPGYLQANAAAVGATFGYGARPLIAVDTSSDAAVALIDDLFTLDITGAWAPGRAVRFDLSVPLYGFRGNSIDAGIHEPTPVGGIGVADMRMGMLVKLLDPGADERGFGWGIVPTLDLPTGWLHPLFGRRAVAAGLGTVVAVDFDRLGLAGRIGASVEPAREDGIPAGPSADLAASVTWVVDDTLAAGVELLAAAPLYAGATGLDAVPVRAVGRIRYADDEGAQFLAGCSVGLSPGVGVSPFRVFFGGGWGRSGHARDRDHDGVADAVDACPQEAEVINGLADDDGCPDRRPRLAVVATLDGDPLAGVEVQLDGPVQRSWTSTREPYVMEVDPESSWKASARLSPCLEGQAIAAVDEVDTKLEIELRRRRFAEVSFYVVDEDGAPMEGAEVQLRSSNPHCVPERVVIDAEGTAIAVVGPGTHTFRVEQGGRAAVATWEAEEGETHEVFMIAVPIR